MHTSAIIVFVGVLVFIAHLFEKLFEETKIPDVLLLILLGVLIGPVLKIVEVSDFGAIGPVFVIIALVVILFQGGTKLKLKSLFESAGGTLGLTTISYILTGGVVAAILYFISDLGTIKSLMLGAIVGGTSSAIVIPLVRELKMSEEASTILQLESAFSDVLVIVVGLALLDAFRLGQFSIAFVFERILTTFLLSGLFGFVAGVVWSILLDKVRHIQDSIFTTPAFVFVIYGLVDLMGYSGAIAALAFGITLGNVETLKLPVLSRFTPLNPLSLSKKENSFFSSVVFLIKTFFFVYMGISIKLEDPQTILYGVLLSFVMIVVRLVAVRISIPKNIPSFDASLMSGIAPKGLAAAVLASLPLQMGIEGGEFIQNITYSVILFSIVLTSIMVFLMERTSLSVLYEKIFTGYAEVEQEKVPQPNGETENIPQE